jgi:hypothetical protein
VGRVNAALKWGSAPIHPWVRVIRVLVIAADRVPGLVDQRDESAPPGAEALPSGAGYAWSGLPRSGSIPSSSIARRSSSGVDLPSRHRPWSAA